MLKVIGYCRADRWADRHTEIQQARIETKRNKHHHYHLWQTVPSLEYSARFIIRFSLLWIWQQFLEETEIRKILVYEGIKVKSSKTKKKKKLNSVVLVRK
jgi:hypothetical protein